MDNLLFLMENYGRIPCFCLINRYFHHIYEVQTQNPSQNILFQFSALAVHR